MNIAIVGMGAMGTVLKTLIDEKDGITCVGSVEPMRGEDLDKLEARVDVVIDFSNPSNFNMIEAFARKNSCGVVIATTGFEEEQIQQIKELSEKVPVVQTANFSLGITVIKRILETITPALKENFDIEIVEKHHNKKLDAPSGTAKLLAKAVNVNNEYDLVFGRVGNRKREKEIGVHAIRGGTITGEHTVIFAGDNEVIEIKHQADSKKIFAVGAIKAAEFVYERKQIGIQNGAVGVGLYNMEDILFP